MFRVHHQEYYKLWQQPLVLIMGWDRSCVGINGSVHYVIPTHDLFYPNPWLTPVAAATIYSAPDDRRKLRPKHIDF